MRTSILRYAGEAEAMSIFGVNRVNVFSRTSTSSRTSLLYPSFLAPNQRCRRSSTIRVKMGYEQDLAIAIKAVSLAARLCQGVQRSLLQSDTQSKLDNSPVTVADYGSQAIISFVLERELPPGSFSMVAEEDSGDLRKTDAHDVAQRITELVNQTISLDGTYNISPLTIEDVLEAIDKGKSEGGSNGRHWVLDPIDGTKGFLRGDQYAIALGLLDEGNVVLGVLGCPNLPCTSVSISVNPSVDNIGCIFSATKGDGALMQSLDGSIKPKRICVSAIENPEEASFFESYEQKHSRHDLSAAIAKILGVKAPPVRLDSQAKYGAMARGDGTIYLRFPHPGYREKIWDHAAGCIVVQEAGGLVVDAAGKSLDFSKGRYLDVEKGIISTNPMLMPLLLNAVKTAVEEKSVGSDGSL